MSLSRRLKRFAVVAAVSGLLLNAAAPMLANAAAALAGVPTGEICEVYGVRFPDAPPPEHVHDAAMAMADDAESDATPDGLADGDDAAVASAPDARADDHHPAGHHHAPGLHAGGHCALTALAAFALPVAAQLAPKLSASSIHRASLDGARPAAFDAVAAWASSRKTGPPATA